MSRPRCTECMSRLLFTCVLVALLAVLAEPAFAGGWAVTSLDPLPQAGFHAGQSYSIGFTIRQHGVSPFNQAQPRIRASLGQEHVNVAARRDGEGHYVATLQFPTAGAWTWKVDQTPFASQELGMIQVLPPLPAAPDEPVIAASPLESAVGYALAGLLAVVVLLWRRPLSVWRRPFSRALR